MGSACVQRRPSTCVWVRLRTTLAALRTRAIGPSFSLTARSRPWTRSRHLRQTHLTASGRTSLDLVTVWCAGGGGGRLNSLEKRVNMLVQPCEHEGSKRKGVAATSLLSELSRRSSLLHEASSSQPSPTRASIHLSFGLLAWCTPHWRSLHKRTRGEAVGTSVKHSSYCGARASLCGARVSQAAVRGIDAEIVQTVTQAKPQSCANPKPKRKRTDFAIAVCLCGVVDTMLRGRAECSLHTLRLMSTE